MVEYTGMFFFVVSYICTFMDVLIPYFCKKLVQLLASFNSIALKAFALSRNSL